MAVLRGYVYGDTGGRSTRDGEDERQLAGSDNIGTQCSPEEKVLTHLASIFILSLPLWIWISIICA